MSPASSGKSTPKGALDSTHAAGESGRWSDIPVLAVDTGGTFTDLVLLRDGLLQSLKVPSDPNDPAGPVLGGIRRILGDREHPRLLLIHGSTVATNAMLERKGARVVLVTNAGFEDVIEIGRQNRPQLYALTGQRPPPLVDRTDRIGVRGRIGPDGQVVEPLDVDEIRALGARIADAEAVAIVLLHSYANRDHEEEVASALNGTKAPVSVSNRILSEFREFERTSTTVANAYLAPKVATYLRRLQREAGDQRWTIRIMGSSGGALSLERAIAEPVRTVLSGPAGGVVGALEWGRRCGAGEVLSFDMGGTSTDVSLVSGTLRQTREGSIGDVPIAIPLLDIHTVGAGGGSIAELDPGGALRVGPQSAGARPGPVCYGLGGSAITVTDAHVWLGRLPPSAFLGGEKLLDRSAIAGPLGGLARQAGTTPETVAEGIVEVANAAMERALRVISVERGVDPAGLDLVAFGGAAGLHAAEIVQRMGLRRAIVPPDPGLLSAHGMLAAPVLRDRSRTVFLAASSPAAPSEFQRVFRDLEAEATADMEADGIPAREVSIERLVDARYRDQSFELQIPAAGWTEAFHEAHEARFGYRREAVEVVAITLRVRAESPGREFSPAAETEARATPRSVTSVLWRGSSLKAVQVDRAAMATGEKVAGPAVIVEYSATTWCPPGWTVERHPSGALILTSDSVDPPPEE